MAASPLPAPSPNQTYVTISALDAGHLTLPESLFITPSDPTHRATVPSLSFLITHPSGPRGFTRLVFDLGLARDLTSYRPAQQTHIANRHPIVSHPDAADSLRAGGLDPAADIDIVLLSHVHWDHVGTPGDFARARFVVGSGTLHLLAHGAGPHYPADIFDTALLPADRTFELPPADPATAASALNPPAPREQQTHHAWTALGAFPAALDYFGDGSVYVIDAPGHLPGHVNVLARVGPRRWVLLGGDCCHDPRIWRGERAIALYDDGKGSKRSVHVDTETARRTVGRVGELVRAVREAEEGKEEGERTVVEVVVAHDREWREANPDKFFPGTL